MNILDTVIGWVNPEAGCRRESWRNELKFLRNYDAGNDDRLNQGWRVQNLNAEQVNAPHRQIIRNRARDLERNSDIAESINKAFERNVVGTGFKLQAKTDKEELNKQIEKLWIQWCKARNCDVTGQQSFVELSRMAERRKMIDGGIIILKRFTDGGLLPFKLQALEVDDLDQNVFSTSKRRIVNGIEYNHYNRPIAYYFKKYDDYGIPTLDNIRVEAKDVIFYWKKDFPSELREMSDQAGTITRVRDINSYVEAVSIKERVAACLAVFIKRNSPVPGGSIGRGSYQTGDSKSISYKNKSITPGMIMELNPGDEISTVTPPAQGTQADAFVRMQQRLAGSGQGLSYESSSRDMSQVNYSSARQGLIEDRKTYGIEQASMIDHFLSDVYETFIISAVLSGKLVIKDFWSKKEIYLEHSWTPPGTKWIDPYKEVQANRIALETNQTTLAEIAAENGFDWRDIIDQRAKENDYIKQKIGSDMNAAT